MWNVISNLFGFAICGCIMFWEWFTMADSIFDDNFSEEEYRIFLQYVDSKKYGKPE